MRSRRRNTVIVLSILLQGVRSRKLSSQNSALEECKQYTTTANQNHAITTTKKLFTVLCDAMRNNPVNTHQHYKEPTAFIFRVRDRDSRLLWNVSMYLEDHTAPGVQRQQSLYRV